MLSIFPLALIACGASTFSRDLGNTHCPRLAHQKDVASADACVAACCAAGDACETWQWCDDGKPCAQGFWAQPGALARGNDLATWPRNTSIAVAEAACAANASCVGLTYHSSELHPSTSDILHIYLKSAPYTAGNDASWSRHMKAAPGCYTGRLDSSCTTGKDGWQAHAVPPRPKGPCDIFASAGTPCVAAHSVVRALYANYTGALYRVLRDSDKASIDVGVHPSTGVAKMADQDSFCAGTSCYILRLYDQSALGNHLDTAPPGGACHHPLKPVNASRHTITLGGSQVIGAYFEGGQGYRRDKTRGVATGQTEQTMYMVTRGDHYNGGCVRAWDSDPPLLADPSGLPPPPPPPHHPP
jgi:hypothetical protein